MLRKITGRPLPIAVILVVAVLAVTGGFRATARCTYYRVLWDGQEVGWVEEEHVVQEAATGLCLQKARAEGMEMVLVNEFGTEPVDLYSPPGQIMSHADLQKAMIRTARFMAVAYAIMVDGRRSVVLPDEGSAQAVLDGIMEDFRQAIVQGDRVTLESLDIVEEVSIERVSFKPEQVVTEEEARRILLRGTDVIKTYEVKRGESLWTIASSNGLSVDELRAANPSMASDLLQVGQELSLVVPEPFITVTSTETMIYDQSIPFPTRAETDDSLWPWQRVVRVPGEPGKKQVTVRIARVNGVETGRETLSTETVLEPKTQVVVQGTKAVPSMGTGVLAWPLDAGQVTSWYGYRRGGMHSGIDIAAPAGTSIRAADKGTVIFSGSLGAYGLTIKIAHGDGMVTQYSHNSANLVNVGTVVEKGQAIARIGTTGRSTGPHVHFEIQLKGATVNPMSYYPK
ncbi:MAG: M23 family metallopeptidase [Bacillota bacterium]